MALACVDAVPFSCRHLNSFVEETSMSSIWPLTPIRGASNVTLSPRGPKYSLFQPSVKIWSAPLCCANTKFLCSRCFRILWPTIPAGISPTVPRRKEPMRPVPVRKSELAYSYSHLPNVEDVYQVRSDRLQSESVNSKSTGCSYQILHHI